MLAIISPAKSLDFEKPANTTLKSTAEFTDHSKVLMDSLSKYSVNELTKLQSISNKLAELNFERNKLWQLPFPETAIKQALPAFTGDVYTGIDVSTFTEGDYATAQKQLRILSGLYGLLKPMDMIMPYRLEMGTKMANARGKNLYQFWGSIITDSVNQSLANSGYDVLVNLASNEYFKAVDTKNVNAHIINPIFKDNKNGQYKIISFYAKKARGLMVRYIVKNQLTEPDSLKGFDLGGYEYNDNLSKGDDWVFTRG